MIVGAAACALVSMVARICAASPKYESRRSLAVRLVAEADALREQFLAGKGRDEHAFAAVVAARGDKPAMQKALGEAAGVPLEGAHAALRALDLIAEALELGNANLASDLGCAAEFAHASLQACAYNVRINHKFMKDESLVASQRAQLAHLAERGGALVAKIRAAISSV